MSATQTTAMPVGAVLADGVRGSAYAELSRQIRQAGLLRRRRGYYAARIAVTAAGFAVGWAVFVLVGDSWWQPAVAVWLAVAFMQLGFVGPVSGGPVSTTAASALPRAAASELRATARRGGQAGRKTDLPFRDPAPASRLFIPAQRSQAPLGRVLAGTGTA